MPKGHKPETIQLAEEEFYMAEDGKVVKLDDDFVYWINGSQKIDQEPWHIAIVDKISASDLTDMAYQKKYSILGVIVGIFFILGAVGALSAMIFNGYYSIWLLGAAPVGFLLGLMLVFGVRRHQVTFTGKDQETQWLCGPLEYKTSGYTVLKIKEWAEYHSIKTSDFPDAMALLSMRRK